MTYEEAFEITSGNTVRDVTMGVLHLGRLAPLVIVAGGVQPRQRGWPRGWAVTLG